MILTKEFSKVNKHIFGFFCSSILERGEPACATLNNLERGAWGKRESRG
jgi:hypothetical protein